MSLADLFSTPRHQAEVEQMPLARSLVERFALQRPFAGCTVVFGHLLVRNSLPLLEAIWRGGARVVPARAHPSPADQPVLDEMKACGVEVFSVAEAVKSADLYFDVNAVLGRARAPRAAAEATRTGVHHYRMLDSTVVSADDWPQIEGFFGTGDAFVRAWERSFPRRPLSGLQLVQFGYGKIGRGVAHRARASGMNVTVADVDPGAVTRALRDGFAVCEARPTQELRRALQQAQVLISVTGVPRALSGDIPPDWIRGAHPVLINMGAEDEFGPAFASREIAGGRDLPFNFQLDEPTHNRYVDPALAAHLLALEVVVARGDQLDPGVHPLPVEMDRWLIDAWRQSWPEEDLTGIAEELGLG